MKVEFIRWPTERDRHVSLAANNTPRLLLIEPDGQAPVTSDPLEDWIRLPADEHDLRARVAGLVEAQAREMNPFLDADGLLHFRERWVAVPPIEGRLLSALVEQYRAVVSRDQLAATGWPQAQPGRNALDVHMLRLRRRIDGLGLAIRTVRSRGYVLEPQGSGAINSAFVKQTGRLT